MQVICVVTRTTSKKDSDISPKMLDDEVNYVRRQYGENILRQIWNRGDANGAVLLLEVKDVEQAKSVIANLPLAKLGFLELSSAMPALPYRGLSPAA